MHILLYWQILYIFQIKYKYFCYVPPSPPRLSLTPLTPSYYIPLLSSFLHLLNKTGTCLSKATNIKLYFSCQYSLSF